MPFQHKNIIVNKIRMKSRHQAKRKHPLKHFLQRMHQTIDNKIKKENKEKPKYISTCFANSQFCSEQTILK